MQLATLVDRPPEGELWLHETKFDGYRLLGFVSNSTARLRTRNGKDWTERFPSIAAALEKLIGAPAVLDMEAVVVDNDGKSSFQALQAALGEGGHPEKDRRVCIRPSTPRRQGSYKTAAHRTQRKSCGTREIESSALRYSEHILVDGRNVLAGVRGGLEGIVSKEMPHM